VSAGVFVVGSIISPEKFTSRYALIFIRWNFYIHFGKGHFNTKDISESLDD
jgi:hypothetical protein